MIVTIAAAGLVDVLLLATWRGYLPWHPADRIWCWLCLGQCASAVIADMVIPMWPVLPEHAAGAVLAWLCLRKYSPPGWKRLRRAGAKAEAVRAKMARVMRGLAPRPPLPQPG